MAQSNPPTPSPAAVPNHVEVSGYGSQTQSPGSPPPKKSRAKLYVVVAALVVAVIIVVAVIAALGGVGKPSPAVFQVVSSGTVWNLGAGTYESAGPVSLTSNPSWTVSGTFTATNGITAYIMTSSEYSAWGGSGSPNAYSWTSGHVTSGTANTYLTAGTYYFVWENTNIFTSTSVEITSSIIATAGG
jgi:hypothetical protein